MTRLCSTVPQDEVVSRMRELWGLDLTIWQVRSYKTRHHLHNGLKTGSFKPGHVPPNKGKRWQEYMSTESHERICEGSRRATVRRGPENPNWVPIGTERTMPDGYVRVKVSDTNDGNLMQRWSLRSHLVWESHNGPLPEDHVIVHLDGDRANDDIDNLATAPKALMPILNKHEAPWTDRETFEVAVLAAEVCHAANRAQKGDAA